MKTQIFYAKDNQIEKQDMMILSQIIKEGGLVAFPTETVYGLGGDATRSDASRKIYEAKGRPSDNPLIVHIAEFSQLEEIVTEVPPEARVLADAFWPGPLTMVLKKNEVIPYETTGGLDTVAIRMPNHPVARAFLQDSGCMIAAPSANVSGRPSPTMAQHVWEDLQGRIEAIIDGGQVEIGIESTIVDLTEDVPTILRPGFVTKEMMEQVLKEVRMDPGITGENKSVAPKAPGMRYRHYAPKAELTLVEGPERLVVEKIQALVEQGVRQQQKVGVIATEETKRRYSQGEVVSIGSRENEAEIAHKLYQVLRSFDEMDVDVIYSESFLDAGVGQAIMNRLLKAAGYKKIQLKEESQQKGEKRKRIIFAAGSGTTRAPMAAGIMEQMLQGKEVEVLPRGIVVQFPEPLNQKAEAVLIGNGIELQEYSAKQLENEEITPDTILFTMEEKQKNTVIDKYENATEKNTFVLSDFVGDELEILDPYGGSLQAYGLCFELLKKSVEKAITRLYL